MFEQVDHIGVATRDIEAALKVLEKTGPLILGKPEVIEAFGIKAVMVCDGKVPIELIEPVDPDSGVAKFIEKKGEGIHHIAYRVSDVDAELEHFREQGFKLIDQKPRHGYADSRVAFIHPKSVLGMLTELVEREPGKDVAPYDPA